MKTGIYIYEEDKSPIISSIKPNKRKGYTMRRFEVADYDFSGIGLKGEAANDLMKDLNGLVNNLTKEEYRQIITSYNSPVAPGLKFNIIKEDNIKGKDGVFVKVTG